MPFSIRTVAKACDSPYDTCKGGGFMLQVAAYCRVSTDKEDQANSFEAQQRYFRDYIERQPDWELQGIYADEGISGTSTRKRVEFNKMLHAAELGQIDLIVTKEVSRFTRNTVDALQITRELRRRGVGVLFLNDSLDTRTNDGELRLTIMSSVAQDESRKTSERSKWGQMRSMEKGVVFGGSLLGYDVIGGKMTVNPEGAEVVRLIFHKYLQERKGCSTIARELREAGILSSKGNCLWSSATVTKILKNEKYCGDLIQKKTYTPDYLTHEKKYNHGKEPLVALKDHHEAIIDRDLWDRVQSIIAARAKPFDVGTVGLFARKVRCANCGYTMRSSKNRGKHYLQCSNRHVAKDACIGSFIAVDKLEKIVIQELNTLSQRYLDQDELERSVEFNQNLEQQKVACLKAKAKLQKQLEDNSNYLLALYKDKVKGLVGEKDYFTMANDFSKERERTEYQIKEADRHLEELEAQMLAGDQRKEIIQRYTHVEHLTREMVEILIDYITVGKRVPGTQDVPIEIYWNF